MAMPERLYLLSDKIGQVAAGLRALVGGLVGAGIGVLALLVGIARFLVALPSGRTAEAGRGVADQLLGVFTEADLYIGGLAATGVLLGLLAGARRSLLTCGVSGFLAGSSLCGVIAHFVKGAPSAEAPDVFAPGTLALGFGVLCGFAAAGWYAWDRWKARQTRGAS
jgi:hypothetical protein